MSPITIYHFPPSPPGRAAVLAARNLPIEFSIKEINLFEKEQLTDTNLNKINPQHCIPTLDDNGFVLWESRAIMGYLAQQYAPDDSLYPKNPQLKAIVDQRLYFDGCTLWPRIRQITFPALFLGVRQVPEDKKTQVIEAFKLLEKFLHGRKWLCGDTLTIADFSCYATMSSAVAIGFDVSPFKEVTAWLNRCRELPGAEENEKGATLFGETVKSKLDPDQI